MDINVIKLNPRETECTLCGRVCRLAQSLPMYEDQVLPDDHPGEWAGMPVCPACYAIHRPNKEIDRKE